MTNICFKVIRRVTIDRNYFLLNKRKYLLTNSRYFSVSKKLYINNSAKHRDEVQNPFKRTWNILSSDFINIKNNLMGKKTEIIAHFPTHCDILIIGGGIMGYSIAYWLQERASHGLKIVVAEKDPLVMNNNITNLEYLKSTTALSVGGIRQQFSLKENIELSLFSAEFLRNINDYLNIKGEDPPNVNFNPAGYLFLSSEKSAEILLENVRLQTSLGAKVEVLEPTQLKEMFPWLNTDGIALASHGLENEGWFDPWSLLCAFKRKALQLGTECVTGEITSFDCNESNEHYEPRRQLRLKNAYITLPDGKENCIRFAICIIAAGAMSGDVARLAGVGLGDGARLASLPVEPRKRYVHVVHCPDGPGFNCPFLIDYSGAYIRREGIDGNYICGISPPDEEEPSVDNLEVEGNYFEEKAWPVIANRVPAFEKCKLRSSWAGFYDVNTFDENAFIGPHPGYENLYLATGFSGHGIQQAPAVGRAIMELIIDSEFKTIDLSRFNFDRYLDGEPLYESNII